MYGYFGHNQILKAFTFIFHLFTPILNGMDELALIVASIIGLPSSGDDWEI